MYLPPHFEERDIAVLHRLMQAHPLAILSYCVANRLEANHLPFLAEPDPLPHGKLLGHVARSNPLWREADGLPVLVVFQGPQAFISPSWYPSKKKTGKVVPTWNYAVVHVRGRLRVVDDPAWLRRCLQKLTSVHEDGRPTPWSMSDAPSDYIERAIAAVVGLEVAIERIEGKWKLSQNKAFDEVAGVIKGLELGAQIDLARMMKARME